MKSARRVRVGTRGSGAARKAGVARRAIDATHTAPAARPIACAVITVSDTRRGRDDRSGDVIQRLVESAGHRVVSRDWTRDEIAAIRSRARAALASPRVDAVLVTGGTGASPRDRTPEALAPLITKRLPGFGERFRALSYDQVGNARLAVARRGRGRARASARHASRLDRGGGACARARPAARTDPRRPHARTTLVPEHSSRGGNGCRSSPTAGSARCAERSA